MTIGHFLTPIYIKDGSCNGLQHYAAIGRDKLGAASVNLVPADKPQENIHKQNIIEVNHRNIEEQFL